MLRCQNNTHNCINSGNLSTFNLTGGTSIMIKIAEFATGKRVLLLVILTNFVYALMIAITIPLVMKSSNGLELLDMMPAGYSPVYVKTLLEILGEEGRHSYLFIQIPVDMLYPLLFGVSYSLLLAYFLIKLGWPKSYFVICLLPLAAGLFDYFENIAVVNMLMRYPSEVTSVAEVASVLTIIKSIFSTFSFMAIVIVGALFLLKKWRTS